MKNGKNKPIKEIFVEAFVNYKKKDFKTAANICYKILSIEPNHFDSISLLATLSAMNNNFEQAKQFLLKANKIQPDNVNVLNNLGTAYKELGSYEEAKSYYSKVLKVDVNHTNAHYNLGLVFYKLKDLDKAKSYLQKTVKIQPNYALAFFSLGNVHVDLKDYESAVSSYQKAAELNPTIVGVYNNLGLVFRILDDFENAISCYNKALEINPNHAGVSHNLALAYKEIGDFKNAIKLHESALKIEPENSMHYFYLSVLKKDILNEKIKNKVKKILISDNCTKTNLAYGNFLLARFENKKQNFSKELDYLIKGHQFFYDTKKEKFKLGIKYCFDDVLQIAEGGKIEETKNDKEYKIKPIFIFGVPRCGSTLLEKIIASGKKLIPMGEETSVLENFFNKKILEKQSLNLGDAKTIRKEIEEIYQKKGLISKKHNYIFTDKSLNNFFYLNLIKIIYPNAKIINCKRDYTSSIISIFQNNLTELGWTHDLNNIFKYFDNYLRIIKNFNDKNSNFILNFQFEKLLKNPEEESKKIMKFCELEWDQKCLEFYKRKDLISKTASNVQIRQAIYSHELDKYLPYKELLKKYGNKYSWFN